MLRTFPAVQKRTIYSVLLPFQAPLHEKLYQFKLFLEVQHKIRTVIIRDPSEMWSLQRGGLCSKVHMISWISNNEVFRRLVFSGSQLLLTGLCSQVLLYIFHKARPFYLKILPQLQLIISYHSVAQIQKFRCQNWEFLQVTFTGLANT